MTKKSFVVSALIVLTAAAVAAGAAEKKYACSLHGLTFESSAEFSAPEKVGLDALMVLHPRKAKPGKETLGITAVLYTRGTQKAMGMGDAGLLNYTKSVFMGVAKAGEKVCCMFRGKSVCGDRVEKKIPVPMIVETYVLALSDGSRVGISFNYPPASRDEAMDLIAEIGASMRE